MIIFALLGWHEKTFWTRPRLIVRWWSSFGISPAWASNRGYLINARLSFEGVKGEDLKSRENIVGFLSCDFQYAFERREKISRVRMGRNDLLEEKSPYLMKSSWWSIEWRGRNPDRSGREIRGNSQRSTFLFRIHLVGDSAYRVFIYAPIKVFDNVYQSRRVPWEIYLNPSKTRAIGSTGLLFKIENL